MRFFQITIQNAIYRFYSNGEWKVSTVPDNWHPIPAAYVPTEVLEVASSAEWVYRALEGDEE
jgi:hypothetical protein